jgi:hypothetical protein
MQLIVLYNLNIRNTNTALAGSLPENSLEAEEYCALLLY